MANLNQSEAALFKSLNEDILLQKFIFHLFIIILFLAIFVISIIVLHFIATWIQNKLMLRRHINNIVIGPRTVELLVPTRADLVVPV